MLFIPYAYQPLAFDQAVQRFLQIPWLALGSDQNVALVSRALTWLPLGLLPAAVVTPRPGRRVAFVALFVGIVASAAWAVAVSFAQQWFPARTFSLNNLVAEVAGGVAGATLWAVFGGGFLRWWRRLMSTPPAALEAALQGYVVVYLIAVLTPFDFVTSVAELTQKLDRPFLYAWWIAPIGCGPAACDTKLLAVVLACVPCGWWFAASRPHERHVWLPATVLALIVGTGIEALHFLMVSGVSQGVSVVARASGMALGALTFPVLRWLTQLRLGRARRPLAAALALPYVAGLLFLAGWTRSAPLGLAAAWARLDQVTWMPFVQEYYSPYAVTMVSLVVHAVAYAGVGVLGWLGARERHRPRGTVAAFQAALLALVVESSKLLLKDRLPDYTDVVIAAAAALVTARVLGNRSRHAPPAGFPSRTAMHAGGSGERSEPLPLRSRSGYTP